MGKQVGKNIPTIEGSNGKIGGSLKEWLVMKADWGERARRGFLGSGIDPADTKGLKNFYIDLLHKRALEEVMELKGDEIVLDFGCGSGRISYWIAPRVKKVVGLEITPAMIELAEANRTSQNVEFVLYDGENFPEFPFKFDVILSVGVLQILRGEELRRVVTELGKYLKENGKGFFIEQVSDNPKVGRPDLSEYLQVFETAGIECYQYYPIRKGRWWLLYLIRYGMIPKKLFFKIASWERDSVKKDFLKKGKREISPYQDYLFIIKQ